MRYGIISDIHSNLEALDAVLKALEDERVGSCICGGDIVGYGADPNECCRLTASRAANAVAGNHDLACVGLFPPEYFNPIARDAILWTRDVLDPLCQESLKTTDLIFRNQDLTFVHGSLARPQDFDYLIMAAHARETFDLMETQVCFVGHTHIPGFFAEDSSGKIVYSQSPSLKLEPGCRYIVNVGSVGQPRDSNPLAAFCIFDTSRMEISIRRIKYDIAAARRKIIKAGLPEFLGDRLLSGI